MDMHGGEEGGGGCCLYTLQSNELFQVLVLFQEKVDLYLIAVALLFCCTVTIIIAPVST